MSIATPETRRWRLVLGQEAEARMGTLSGIDAGMDKALAQLYQPAATRKGGLGASSPNVARWLGDIRSYFPTSVVQLLQKDAIERLHLRQLLLEPEVLASIEVDVHLVATLLDLRQLIPEQTKATARQVVAKLVADIEARLRNKLCQAVRGALDRSQRTRRPRHSDIDWPRTIRRNLKNWQANEQQLIVSELSGHARRTAGLVDVLLCVDQSGSMATSVVYASIFAATLASIRALNTQLVLFDTVIVDLTELLSDPVEVLFGTQLGGGTDIHAALSYCASQIRRPQQTTMVLISDLYEGGNAPAMRAKAAEIVSSGVNLIVLLALSDDGAPSYDVAHARYFANIGAPTFACTPDHFPGLIAVALQRGDVAQWAAKEGLVTTRG